MGMRENSRHFKTAVIGAGASGCMAAVSAAMRGGSVLLLESNDRIGRKIYATGNGRCNLANSLDLVELHSPLTITEVHHHSDALAPDPGGKRVPFSAGTSVNYNFIDYRFRNDTLQPVQLCTWCEGDNLFVELRTTVPFPVTYRIVEEEHHFHQESNGKFYRVSKIYRETLDRATEEVKTKELIWDNHSEVMFDYSLIPKEQIR